MKRCALLILLILMACLSYSQGVDKIIVNDSDTLLCFNLEKSRILAKTIVHADYCDSILVVQEEKVSYMDSIISAQKEIIFISSVQLDNCERVIELKDKQISNLNIMVSESEKEIKKQKRIKWISIFGSGIAGAICILK